MCFVAEAADLERPITSRLGRYRGAVFGTVLAETLFLGEDLLAWIVLALGGAMLVGNAMALIRPPAGSGAETGRGSRPHSASHRPPLARTLVMMGIGVIAAIWAIASLSGT